MLAQTCAALIGLDSGLVAGKVVQFCSGVNERRAEGPPERGPGSVMDLSSRTATVAGLDMVGWFLLLALLRWRTCSEAMASTHADTQGKAPPG